MAQFKFDGAQVPIRIDGVLLSQEPKVTHVRVPQKDGDVLVATASDPETGFIIGENLGIDFTDEVSLDYLRCDPRFTEIV